MDKKGETIVISLGGSLVAPDKIDLAFLDNFKRVILNNLNGRKFYIYVGGGKMARVYQQVLAEYGASDEEKDWAGIGVTRINAQIVARVFDKFACPKIITDPTRKLNGRYDILVGGGWKPGRSTDYGSVLLAKTAGAKTVINLTNIDYVCDKDPSKFPDAKKIEKISWPDFRKIVGSKWSPGLSSPFDPVASQIAEKLKLKVVIINGKNLERLDHFLNNKPFIGTIIHPVK